VLTIAGKRAVAAVEHGYLVRLVVLEDTDDGGRQCRCEAGSRRGCVYTAATWARVRLLQHMVVPIMLMVVKMSVKMIVVVRVVRVCRQSTIEVPKLSKRALGCPRRRRSRRGRRPRYALNSDQIRRQRAFHVRYRMCPVRLSSRNDDLSNSKIIECGGAEAGASAYQITILRAHGGGQSATRTCLLYGFTDPSISDVVSIIASIRFGYSSWSVQRSCVRETTPSECSTPRTFLAWIRAVPAVRQRDRHTRCLERALLLPGHLFVFFSQWIWAKQYGRKVFEAEHVERWESAV
jgi:hypothetical protein